MTKPCCVECGSSHPKVGCALCCPHPDDQLVPCVDPGEVYFCNSCHQGLTVAEMKARMGTLMADDLNVRAPEDWEICCGVLMTPDLMFLDKRTCPKCRAERWHPDAELRRRLHEKLSEQFGEHEPVPMNVHIDVSIDSGRKPLDDFAIALAAKMGSTIPAPAMGLPSHFSIGSRSGKSAAAIAALHKSLEAGMFAVDRKGDDVRLQGLSAFIDSERGSDMADAVAYGLAGEKPPKKPMVIIDDPIVFEPMKPILDVDYSALEQRVLAANGIPASLINPEPTKPNTEYKLLEFEPQPKKNRAQRRAEKKR